MTDMAADFTDGAGRQHISDAAAEKWIQQDTLEALCPQRPYWEREFAACGVMLITREEWLETQAKLAAKDEWIDELEARYRNALERLRVLAPKPDVPAEPSIGALLLRAREADKRLGLGDAGRER